MKYVVTWKPRAGGSAAENEASAARFLSLTRDWNPSRDTTIHQYVLRIDGGGGFAIIESDDPVAVARTFFRLAPLIEYTAYPVVDSDEGFRAASEAEEARRSVA
jgi:hypothetical protein